MKLTDDYTYGTVIQVTQHNVLVKTEDGREIWVNKKVLENIYKDKENEHIH